MAAAPAKTPKKASPTSKKKALARKTTSGTSSSAKARYVRDRHGRLVRVRSRVPAGPSYQLHPDPERYQQIQQALADKGYFKGAVNGQWADDSVDALKRFQTDQKIDPDGHLNALTLKGLGLGPKHEGNLSSTAPASPTNVPNNSALKTGPSLMYVPVASPTSPPPGASPDS